MSQANATDLEFNEFAEAPANISERSADPVGTPAYLLDGERVSAYLTLAGLLDADIPLETALMLLTTEAKAQRKQKAERVARFFNSAASTRATVKSAEADGLTALDIIGESAAECFGGLFLSDQELVLLRGLAYTDNFSPLLRAAADVIRVANESLPAPQVQKTPGRHSPT